MEIKTEAQGRPRPLKKSADHAGAAPIDTAVASIDIGATPADAGANPVDTGAAPVVSTDMVIKGNEMPVFSPPN